MKMSPFEVHLELHSSFLLDSSALQRKEDNVQNYARLQEISSKFLLQRDLFTAASSNQKSGLQCQAMHISTIKRLG